MKQFGVFAVVLLALAVINAPFGMGQMMAQAKTHPSMHASHDTQHDTPAGHKGPAMRYFFCAACIAVAAPVPSSPHTATAGVLLDISEPLTPDGLLDLPLVPPPISIS